MRYLGMDHAGWAERNLQALKLQCKSKRYRDMAAESRGPLAAPETLNEFPRRAFDILGIVGGGIYNAPIAWKSIYITPRMIVVQWRNSMSTFDFDELTKLVFLCHEARIRAGVAPGAPRHLEIMLSERAADGGLSARHPNLDEAIKHWRDVFPSDHYVGGREAQPA